MSNGAGALQGWQRRLLTNTMWVSLGILLGRLAGFVRETSLAARFGASPEADVAVVLLTVPDIFVNLLVGGALSVALIPAFKRYGAGPRAQALFVQGSLLTGLAFLLVAALASYFAAPLIALAVPGLAQSHLVEAESLLGWTLWVIPLTTLAGVSTAYLQAHERFVLPAMGTLIFNSVLVVALLWLLDQEQPLQGLVPAILAAALLRWVSQLARLPRRPWGWRALRWSLIDRPLLLRYLQALGAGGLITLLPVIARAFGSQSGEGNLALLNYALKLVEFPLGVAITVLAVAIYPTLSQAHARGEDAEPALCSALRWVLVLALAMWVSLFSFRELFAQLTFGWGRMTPEAVETLAGLFGLGLLSLPLQGLSSLMLAAFNARHDTVTPLRVNAWVVLLFLPASWVAQRLGGLDGVVWAMVAAYLAIMLAQALLLQRRHGVAVWHLLELGRTLRLLALTAALALCLPWLRDVLPEGWLWPLLAAVGAGIMVLFCGLLLMGEGQALIRRLTRRGR